MTFCPFLDTREAVLGEFIFRGANGNQIEKFYLGWKVDIQGFPTSYHELNLDVGKCPKNRLKGALRIGIRALRIGVFGPIFILQLRNSASFHQFYSLM